MQASAITDNGSTIATVAAAVVVVVRMFPRDSYVDDGIGLPGVLMLVLSGLQYHRSTYQSFRKTACSLASHSPPPNPSSL